MWFRQTKKKVKRIIYALIGLFLLLLFLFITKINIDSTVLIIGGGCAGMIALIILLFRLNSKPINEENEKLKKDKAIIEDELLKAKNTPRIFGISTDISELALKELPLTIPINIEHYYDKDGERVYNKVEIENSLKNHIGFMKVSGTLTFSTKIKIGFDFKQVRYNVIENEKMVITGFEAKILSGFDTLANTDNIIVLQAQSSNFIPGFGDTYWTQTDEVYKFKDFILKQIVSKEEEKIKSQKSEQILKLIDSVNVNGENWIKNMLGSKYSSIDFNPNLNDQPLLPLFNDDGGLNEDI